jgi:ribosomal protein S18 acetylase RimI-like enzyme
MTVSIIDVTSEAGFDRIPPCADNGFDHRSCDYWEDEARGSKAARLAWLSGAPAPAPRAPAADNPFAPTRGPAFNPFDPRAASGSGGGARPANPFAFDDQEEIDNPFAPKREARPAVSADAPRKLQLLGRGLGVFGSYAKVLEVDGEPAAYCQFGPLSAYPRAQRVRDLYRQLPSAPLPAVITCIATTSAARRQGHARELVLAVLDDLATRGFSAVEAYPEPGARPDATSAATPEFWVGCGFEVAVADDRFPVVRKEL